jgi:hypothetical protein
MMMKSFHIIILLFLLPFLFVSKGFSQEGEQQFEEEKTLKIINEEYLEASENQNSDLQHKIDVSNRQQVIINQQGNSNQAYVVQQRYGGSASNYTEINQRGNNHNVDVGIKGNNNAVRVLQDNLESGLGAGNAYLADIHGNANLVDVEQRGSNNTIKQSVTGDQYNYQVKQVGSNHTLELDNLVPTANPIVIEQNGEGMNLQIDNTFVPVTGKP